MEHLRFPRNAEEASAECHYAWIEDRIRFLADAFAVSIYSYAVMSNHTHIVLNVDPEAVSDWNDDEVADRWLRVFPGAMAQASSEEQKQRVRMSLLSTPDRLKEIRGRLGSLSWFMRALNEPIARMANQEDNCTRGRSIKARFFHAQRLRICASYLVDKPPSYFRLRCAKTADFAFPTLAGSGRVDSSAKRCWSRRRLFLPWPTWI
jgi:hypothetical protein